MTSFIHQNATFYQLKGGVLMYKRSSIIISSNMFYNNTMSIMVHQISIKRLMKICEINVTLSQRVLRC